MKKANGTQFNGRNTHYIALSGMTLALCLLSLMIFRGPLSLLQALIIPIVMVIMTIKQPWKYTFAAGISLLMLTLAFFLTQIIFMIIYLMMAFLLLILVSTIQRGPRHRNLLIILYLLINALLLYLGLRLTDIIFQTPLHVMMLKLSSDNNILYASILIIESTFISIFHLLIVLNVSRRQARTHR
ncbi:MAG: hypothetical protein Q8S15_03785 [Erysipelotrichaceae bacterium]|nr:hypothetical protein [Erysipelotrichaceae bacterium]MDP3305171.1 hypothetical protein [Erysipelotrichaceae bacterium]